MSPKSLSSVTCVSPVCAMTSLYSVFVAPLVNTWAGPVMIASIVFHATVEYVANRWAKNGGLSRWKSLKEQERHQFGNTVTATLHSMAAWGMIKGYIYPSAELIQDPLYGYSESSQLFFAWSAGYFLYDIYAVLTENYGLAFVVHGFAAFFSIFFGLYPFLHHAGRFYVGFFELSTPFLHMRTLLSTYLGMENSIPHLAVSLLFLVFFVGVRVILNSYISFFFMKDMWNLIESGKAHSNAIVVFFVVSNLTFYLLHLWWTKDIIKGIVNTVKTDDKKKVEDKKKSK